MYDLLSSLPPLTDEASSHERYRMLQRAKMLVAYCKRKGSLTLRFLPTPPTIRRLCITWATMTDAVSSCAPRFFPTMMQIFRRRPLRKSSKALCKGATWHTALRASPASCA